MFTEPVTGDAPDLVVRRVAVGVQMTKSPVVDVHAHGRRHATDDQTPNPSWNFIGRRRMVNLEYEHGDRYRQRRQSHEVYTLHGIYLNSGADIYIYTV